MMQHPVKRYPLPYIYATIYFPLNNEPQSTEKSNAVPPCWNRNTFKFDIKNTVLNDSIDEDVKKLRITVIESRLFMVEEPLGFCDIYISSLPQDKVLIQWVTLTSLRPELPKMMCLLMIHLNSNPNFSSSYENTSSMNLNGNSDDSMIFDAPLASPEDIIQFEPWDPREVEFKYLSHIHLENSIFPLKIPQDPLNEEGDIEFENSQEASMYQSPLKSILKMFS